MLHTVPGDSFVISSISVVYSDSSNRSAFVTAISPRAVLSDERLRICPDACCGDYVTNRNTYLICRQRQEAEHKAVHHLDGASDLDFSAAEFTS